MNDSYGGFVSIVGAGPGDPKLLTLAAREALQASDVVIYDHLVNPVLLRHAPKAQLVYVGKKGGDPDSTPQGFIETLLLRLARRGKRIVRLKAGDPFVFGRGGEEALWLRRHQIPFEVIPGITAGIAAPAYAGIPVTHRKLASEVTLVTAHEDPLKGNSDLNWKALAELKGTLVLYMGMKTLPHTVKQLLRYGKKPDTPVAVIQWGTTAEQKVATGTLQSIVREIKETRLGPPAVTVIGEVGRLRNQLKWFEEKPLFGKTVLITRSRHQASQLRETLEGFGARVIEVPTIRIVPIRTFGLLDRAIRNIRQSDWVVFTSENGVETFFSRLKKLGKDARILGESKIAAIGPGTKAKLNVNSIEPDLMPSTFTTEGLLSAFRKVGVRGKRILLLRTDIAPDFLRHSLERLGARVSEVPVYRTEKPEGLHRQVQEIVCQTPIDYMTFTSSSTAHHFFEALQNGHRHFPLTPTLSPGGSVKAKVVSIGPVTSEAIRSFGVRVDREAKVSTIPGLVEAVLEEEKK